MKAKKFNCVDMMHHGAKRIYEATKNMSREAELNYWLAKTKKLSPTARQGIRRAAAVRESHTGLSNHPLTGGIVVNNAGAGPRFSISAVYEDHFLRRGEGSHGLDAPHRDRREEDPA